MTQQASAQLKSGGFARRNLHITFLFASLFLPDFAVSPNVQASVYRYPLARSLPQAQQNPGAQNAEDITTPEPGKPIERDLAGGQSHTYQIALTEGQYLNAIVEQRGIDVVVRLLGPDGKQIAEFDSEIRGQGQETVAQVAEISGSYRLIVQAKQKEAPVGRYEIRIGELRAATEKDRALQEARRLNAEFARLYRAGKLDEARLLGEQVLEIREKALGTEHPDVAASLTNLAILYSAKGDFVKAESLHQRALVIREKTLGPDHPNVAGSLNSLAILYSNKGDYLKAEPLWRSALAIREKAFGPDHPSVAASLNNLAILYRDKGDFAKAEPLHQRALGIREKTLGPDHPDVAASLYNLAILYYDKGNYAKAEPLWQRALAIKEKALGPDHPDVADSLNGLAALSHANGHFAKAEPLYQRALAILEKALGPDHPLVAASINNLAVLYLDKGDYAKVEPLYQRALAIKEKAFGPDHPNVADFLNNIANLYREKGDYARAEPLHQRALAIREKSLGPDHLDVAASLTNLAVLYSNKSDYARAEPLHQRALAILEKALGPDHPDVARSHSNLADLYREKGDFANAEPLHQRALAILEKALGPEHPDVAKSLNNLALLYREKGDYAKAEPLHQRALVIREKALGQEHPDVAQSLSNLAKLYAAKGDTTLAVAFQSRASTVSERNLTLNLTTGSERQKMAYLATISAQADQTISLHVNAATNDLTARNLAATIILQRKGRVLDAMTDSLAALRRRFNAEDQAMLDQFRGVTSQLARLVFNGPQKMTHAEHQKMIKDLEDEKEKLEAAISQRSDEFRVQSQPITLSAVQAAIPPGAVLIEFAAYRPFNPKVARDAEAYGEPHYVAYMVPQQGEIQWRELGEAKAIDDAIAEWRKALRDPQRQDVKERARAVDAKLMQPVRLLLGATAQLLISPDGALNLIPFAALVDEQGRYLVDRYSFSYLTSGRDLLRLQASRASQSKPLVVADPEFGEPEPSRLTQADAPKLKPAARARKRQEMTTGTDLSSLKFMPLSGTAEEAQAIKSLFPEAAVLTKGQATEAALKQAVAPRILHIATHGFFLEDQPLKIESSGGDGDVRGLGAHVRIENPLLRSGLALAGANLRKGGDDDGILTSLEASALNLWGTKLVTLSACDTGVGEVKTGEGVYGLRRALTLAGVETQVMSLWPVSDYMTRELMAAYYTGLKRGQGRGEALRQVQLKMLQRPGRRHPFFWASFIQSGEWDSLDSKR